MGQAGAIDSTSLPREAVTERGVPIHFDPADLHLMDTRVALEPAPLAAFNLSVRAAELSAQPGFDRLPLVREMETFGRWMKQIGNRLITARDAYFNQRAVDDRIFGDRFKPVN